MSLSDTNGGGGGGGDRKSLRSVTWNPLKDEEKKVMKGDVVAFLGAATPKMFCKIQ